MAAHGVGIARICATVAIATIVALNAGAADRTAGVITPEGSPLYIDPWRATLFDTPALSVSITNRHSAPVAFTLRVWVFDPADHLRGTMTWCVTTPLDRSMRGVFYIPLEIRGITARDRGAVTVENVVGDGVSWTLREPPDEVFEAARAEVRGSGGRLTLERRTSADIVQPFTCPCDCPAVQSVCERECAPIGLGAFTCSPVDGTGCSASCSCK